MKKLLARGAALLILIAALSVSMVGCRAKEAEVEEPPAATTETTTMEEPGTMAPMDTAMGTDMTTSEPMTTDAIPPGPPEDPAEADAVIINDTQIAKSFPDYNEAVAAGKIKEVKVFYATDRKPLAKSNPSGFAFGVERSDPGRLTWGTCVVSLPKNRKIGSLPGVGVSTRQENPHRHVVLMRLDHLPKDIFVKTLQTSVSAARKKELLVFVHGFNVTFENAARRTAQLAVDLEFEGVPVFYSWPAQGELSRAKYRMDQKNALWTIPRLESFLMELADRSGATAIHLIAHSMGSDALTQALGRISLKNPGRLPMFTDVILTAPDIDRANFLDLAAEFKTASRRFTLYASSRDKALQYANQVNRFPRAGDIGAGIVFVPGVETIDVSSVDESVVGHFYYASNQPVIVDMKALVNEGKTAGHRSSLESRESGGNTYWRLKAPSGRAPGSRGAG
jgi:esterase/lipase superfamily enzyme